MLCKDFTKRKTPHSRSISLCKDCTKRTIQQKNLNSHTVDRFLRLSEVGKGASGRDAVSTASLPAHPLPAHPRWCALTGVPVLYLGKVITLHRLMVALFSWRRKLSDSSLGLNFSDVHFHLGDLNATHQMFNMENMGFPSLSWPPTITHDTEHSLLWTRLVHCKKRGAIILSPKSIVLPWSHLTLIVPFSHVEEYGVMPFDLLASSQHRQRWSSDQFQS